MLTFLDLDSHRTAIQHANFPVAVISLRSVGATPGVKTFDGYVTAIRTGWDALFLNLCIAMVNEELSW